MKLWSHANKGELSKALKRHFPSGHTRRCTTRCIFPALSLNLSTTNRYKSSFNCKLIFSQCIKLETSEDMSD